MSISQPSRLLGVSLVLAATLCWSLSGPLVRLMERPDAWTVAGLRAGIAAPLVFLALAVQVRGEVVRAFAHAGWRAAAAGLCLATMQIAYMLAIARTTVANAMLIYAAAPIVAALLAWPFLGERPTLRLWLAMAATLFGIGIMAAGELDGGAVAGNVLALLIALAGGIYVVVLRGAGGRNMIPSVVCGTVFCALAALPFARLGEIPPGDWRYLALLGVVQMALPTTLFVIGARHLGAAELALLAQMEVVLGPFLAWLIVGETPGTPALVGGALVLAAVLWIARPARPRGPPR
jgi:drug/metabolite transporter (DMT)-like permease